MSSTIAASTTEIPQTATPLQKVGTIVLDNTPRETKSVFFAHGGPTTYVFKNGQTGAFVRGGVPFSDAPAFVTDKIGYINELKEQIKEGAVGFYQLPEYESITTEQLDPYLDIKREAARLAIEEYKKTQEVRDMGQTDSKPTLQGIANTSTIAAGAAGSDSGSSASLASLASLSAAIGKK